MAKREKDPQGDRTRPKGGGSSGGESGGGESGGGESGGTVVIAGTANALMAIGKIVVGLMTGSSAMMSEGAHSVADTLNEGFLWTALRRSRRRPDARHPFGYGKERFFWSMIAAVGIFVAGGGFSLLEAYQAFRAGDSGGSESFLPAYIMLGIGFLLEGTSWLRAVRQTRREAAERGRGIVEHIRISADPTVKTVASEDSAALVGLLLAGIGLLLHQLTGHIYWEGVASALIAVLLIVVAVALANDSKGLLIGEAADEDTRQRICDVLQSRDGVDEVLEVLTMRVGSDQVLVAVRVDFDEALSAEDVEDLSTELDRLLHEQVPDVYQVFLDATDAETRRRGRCDGTRSDQPYPSSERTTNAHIPGRMFDS